MSLFSGLRPVFGTLTKHYSDVLENKLVFIAQYSGKQEGNPESTINQGGYYYSDNDVNASVTYYIPCKVLVRGYELTSYNTDIFPKSWVLEGSNDGETFNELHISRNPLCENNSYAYDGKIYCSDYVTKSFRFKNNIFYSYFRIKMFGENTGNLQGHMNVLIFSHIELYAVFGFPFQIVKNKECMRNKHISFLFLVLFIS